MATSKLFTSKLSTSQLNKVIEVAKKLNFNPNWLLAVMYNETAHTFSPSITNSIGSVGLIQFTRDKAGVDYKTIGGKQYKLSYLKTLSFEQQMDIVYLYYVDVKKMLKKEITSFTDCYLATFFPLAIGKPDDFLFQTSGLTASKIATQNPQFDTNKDGKIYKKEVTDFFRKYYSNIFDKEINNSDGVDNFKLAGNYVANNIGDIAVIIALPLAVFFYSVLTLNVLLTN